MIGLGAKEILPNLAGRQAAAARGAGFTGVELNAFRGGGRCGRLCHRDLQDVAGAHGGRECEKIVLRTRQLQAPLALWITARFVGYTITHPAHSECGGWTGRVDEQTQRLAAAHEDHVLGRVAWCDMPAQDRSALAWHQLDANRINGGHCCGSRPRCRGRLAGTDPIDGPHEGRIGPDPAGKIAERTAYCPPLPVGADPERRVGFAAESQPDLGKGRSWTLEDSDRAKNEHLGDVGGEESQGRLGWHDDDGLGWDSAHCGKAIRSDQCRPPDIGATRFLGDDQDRFAAPFCAQAADPNAADGRNSFWPEGEWVGTAQPGAHDIVGYKGERRRRANQVALHLLDCSTPRLLTGISLPDGHDEWIAHHGPQQCEITIDQGRNQVCREQRWCLRGGGGRTIPWIEGDAPSQNDPKDQATQHPRDTFLDSHPRLFLSKILWVDGSCGAFCSVLGRTKFLCLFSGRCKDRLGSGQFMATGSTLMETGAGVACFRLRQSPQRHWPAPSPRARAPAGRWQRAVCDRGHSH